MGPPTRTIVSKAHGEKTADASIAKRESRALPKARGSGGNEIGIPELHDCLSKKVPQLTIVSPEDPRRGHTLWMR